MDKEHFDCVGVLRFVQYYGHVMINNIKYEFSVDNDSGDVEINNTNISKNLRDTLIEIIGDEIKLGNYRVEYE